MTSVASTASMTSTTSFHQKITDPDVWIIPSTQNDQHQSLFVELIIKNPFFYWYLIPFLSEAVEVSQCYFFWNRLMKLKWVNLLNTLGTKNQQNYQSFYPPDPFTLGHFIMRHPVCIGLHIKSTWLVHLETHFNFCKYVLCMQKSGCCITNA